LSIKIDFGNSNGYLTRLNCSGVNKFAIAINQLFSVGNIVDLF